MSLQTNLRGTLKRAFTYVHCRRRTWSMQSTPWTCKKTRPGEGIRKRKAPRFVKCSWCWPLPGCHDCQAGDGCGGCDGAGVVAVVVPAMVCIVYVACFICVFSFNVISWLFPCSFHLVSSSSSALFSSVYSVASHFLCPLVHSTYFWLTHRVRWPSCCMARKEMSPDRQAGAPVGHFSTRVWVKLNQQGTAGFSPVSICQGSILGLPYF